MHWPGLGIMPMIGLQEPGTDTKPRPSCCDNSDLCTWQMVQQSSGMSSVPQPGATAVKYFCKVKDCNSFHDRKVLI